MDLIRAVQDSGFGVWMRESMWGLFGALIIHTFTMGFMVGTAGVIAARALGLMKTVPFGQIARLFVIMQTAGVIAIVSGLALVAAYPSKALTNPLFYIKLVLALLAFGLSWRLVRSTGEGRLARVLAIATLLLWPLALTTGKYLAYTYHVLLVY